MDERKNNNHPWDDSVYGTGRTEPPKSHGGTVALLLFALLIIRVYWLALNARDRFGSLVIVGITTLFAFQVFANVAVVTNLFAVTGISLPFFSYGGSALIIQLAEMGLILSISRQNPAS